LATGLWRGRAAGGGGGTDSADDVDEADEADEASGERAAMVKLKAQLSDGHGPVRAGEGAGSLKL
jgi:hypothetical protein